MAMTNAERHLVLNLVELIHEHLDGLTWRELDELSALTEQIKTDAPLFVEVSGYLPDGHAGAYSYPAVAVRPDGALGARIEGVDACPVRIVAFRKGDLCDDQ